MIEKSVSACLQEIIVPLPVSIFLNKILFLYSQRVELPRTCGKCFYHEISNFMTDYIPERREKNAQYQLFCHFFMVSDLRSETKGSRF